MLIPLPGTCPHCQSLNIIDECLNLKSHTFKIAHDDRHLSPLGCFGDQAEILEEGRCGSRTPQAGYLVGVVGGILICRWYLRSWYRLIHALRSDWQARGASRIGEILWQWLCLRHGGLCSIGRGRLEGCRKGRIDWFRRETERI